MSKIIPDKFIQDNRDASPIGGIPMALSVTGSPADFTTPSSDDTAARKKEVDKNLKALSPKQSAEEPNANKDAAGRILKAILGNPESIAELKKILAAIKGPSTSLFSGWGEKGSSSSSADTNPRSRNTHPRGNDTGHSGDRASTDTESGDRASTDTESDDTVPHSNKSNISSTDAYKKMKTIKDMKLPEQITGLNSLLTSFEKPPVGLNVGGAGMTDDDKNVLNMAILTFIREHAYDSILFKGLNDYDELYGTLNGILIENFKKTKDQKKTKAQNKKNFEVATAQDDLNSAKEAIKVLMQKHKDEDIMEAKERVTELDAEKTNTEQQLAKATIAQKTDVGDPESKIATPMIPQAPVPPSQPPKTAPHPDILLEQYKQRWNNLSDVADQKEKSLQQQKQKIDHGSKDINNEVDTLTNKLLEIKQKLAQATTYVTTLEKARTEKEKNTRASTTRGNREAELEQQYNKIKEANIILETAQQSPTAEEVTIAVDQADDDPTPEKLIQNLLDILLEKTSPIYTPQYFELKKEFSYNDASNGNPAIYTDIKPYYKRVFMTRSMTHKQNPWKKTTDTVYYIMPSGPSGELGSLVRESTRGLPVVGSCAIQYVQGTTTISGEISGNAKDDKPGQKLQELRAFICSRNNCNRGQMVSLPKDDPLIKSPVKGNEKRAFETLDSSMHQAEEENHARSLEISTYLWELLRYLSGPRHNPVKITYKGNYIYYHENNNENNPTILKSRSYLCKPTPYKNYITLYDISGKEPITNFLYGIDRNASKYGENNASITIDNNHLGLTASMEMFNSGTDSRTGEADEDVHVSSPSPVLHTNSTVILNNSNPSRVVPKAAPQGNLQQQSDKVVHHEYPHHGGKKPEYEYDILKACILANLYTLILFINIKPLSNPIEALYNAFKDGHILGSEDKRDPILKTDPINAHITIPETTGLFIRKTTPITIKPIFNGYDNAKDWFKGCVTNSTLFNCIIYKGHTNYLPIESVIGKYSIYNNLEDRTKLFSNYPYDYRIEQYNKLYLTRYRAINKMGDLSRKSRKTLMTGTSGYTAQELRVIEQAVKDPSTRNNPLLYPDMYNLQKGVALTKDKTCKSNGTFRSNLYLIFGDKNGYVISQGGGSKKKTASNHKKYNKDKLYMKQLNKQRQTKPNKTNKRKKNAKKYTNKRYKSRK